MTDYLTPHENGCTVADPCSECRVLPLVTTLGPKIHSKPVTCSECGNDRDDHKPDCEIGASGRKLQKVLPPDSPALESNRFDAPLTHVGILPVDLVHQKDQPRTMREILFTHRALAQARPEEITELMAELAPLIVADAIQVKERDGRIILTEARADNTYQITGELLDRIVTRFNDQQAVAADARRQLASVRAADKLFRKGRAFGEERWRKSNPGLTALLEAVDG